MKLEIRTVTYQSMHVLRTSASLDARNLIGQFCFFSWAKEHDIDGVSVGICKHSVMYTYVVCDQGESERNCRDSY